jgi:purine-binding chemotaxis protein CheW
MENNIISYLTFRIGSEIFATNVKYIQNIIEFTKITKVPEMPPFVLGVTNLRGEVLMVFDSRIKLGIPETQLSNKSSIIVLELTIEGTKTKAGMLVDEVSEVLEIEDEHIKVPPSIGMNFRSDIITGVFPAGEKFIMLLDIHKVIASEEILSIQEA